jgi:hypothetical protein
MICYRPKKCCKRISLFPVKGKDGPRCGAMSGYYPLAWQVHP